MRLILKKDARIEEVQQHGDMPPLQVADTAPRFEDAFIDLLGGAGTAESPLGAIIHRVDGSKEETVIEAQSLTKSLVISPLPTMSISVLSAVKFSACSAPTAPGNPPPSK